MPSVSVATSAPATSTSATNAKIVQPAAGSKDAKTVTKQPLAGPVAAVKKVAEPCLSPRPELYPWTDIHDFPQ